jgi:hypothetical protein
MIKISAYFLNDLFKLFNVGIETDVSDDIPEVDNFDASRFPDFVQRKCFFLLVELFLGLVLVAIIM